MKEQKTFDKKLNSEHKTWEPEIVGFLCQWCSYAGADLAGSGRMKYPSNIKIIRVPCSGRIDPMFIIKALRDGIDGVLVSGCHPGDCHYTCGNMHARRKFTVLHEMLNFMGIDERRVHFSWVSASEGEKFVKVINKVVDDIREAGPNMLFGVE